MDVPAMQILAIFTPEINCALLKSLSLQSLLLSLLSGLLLAFGWPERGIPLLLFAGLVPMLLLEDLVSRKPERFIRFSVLLLSYPGFLLWNLLTTWWIVNSTTVGAVLAILLNALFMSIILQAFHWTKKKTGFAPAGYAAFITYWLSLEYLHLNWDLNWPWLNLGNGFASWYRWVEWYEFTGTFGGSLWILGGNLLIFYMVRGYIHGKKAGKEQLARRKPVLLSALTVLLWIFVPALVSLIIYRNYREEQRPVRFVVVQPNLDPYSEQYNLPPSDVIGRIMDLALQKTDSATDFLIAPESAIQENMWENDLASFASIRMLQEALSGFPKLNMVVGGSTFYQLHPDEPLPRWARKFTDSDQHYVAYNAAILISNRDTLQVYHKSKLTPGVEILPSFKGFRWLERYAIDLGGTVGSLGMDEVRKVYRPENSVPVSAAICYESVFGEFFAGFVRNGAQVMTVITNDGWWGNTGGYRQHYAFSHLRAIETRRSIARSANTGISAFIDQRGDAHQVTGYWVPAVIEGTLNASDRLTFYVKHGDYLARFATWLGGLLLLTAIGLSLRRRLPFNN
jgi:apolipoprotein N-acyltransferase